MLSIFLSTKFVVRFIGTWRLYKSRWTGLEVDSEDIQTEKALTYTCYQMWVFFTYPAVCSVRLPYKSLCILIMLLSAAHVFSPVVANKGNSNGDWTCFRIRLVQKLMCFLLLLQTKVCSNGDWTCFRICLVQKLRRKRLRDGKGYVLCSASRGNWKLLYFKFPYRWSHLQGMGMGFFLTHKSLLRIRCGVWFVFECRWRKWHPGGSNGLFLFSRNTEVLVFDSRPR